MEMAEKFRELYMNIEYPSKKMPKILYTEAKKKYYEDQHKIIEDFKLALFKEYEVEDNTKREKCFEIAWEKRHSLGFNEVEIIFSELVELIK